MKSRIRSERIASMMCWRGAARPSRVNPVIAGEGLDGIDELHRAAMRALEQQRRFATARFNCAPAEADPKIQAP